MPPSATPGAPFGLCTSGMLGLRGGGPVAHLSIASRPQDTRLSLVTLRPPSLGRDGYTWRATLPKEKNDRSLTASC